MGPASNAVSDSAGYFVTTIVQPLDYNDRTYATRKPHVPRADSLVCHASGLAWRPARVLGIDVGLRLASAPSAEHRVDSLFAPNGSPVIPGYPR